MAKSSSIVDIIVSGIKQDINSGIYEQGDRLREVELAERFGVSRTPLREAFRILQSQGLLTHKPGSGMMVNAKLNENEIAERFYVLGVLSSEAGYLAAIHATDVQKQEIVAVCEEMRNLEFDALYASHLDRVFHSLIGSASGNTFLASSIISIQGFLEGFSYALQFRKERYEHSIQEHYDIVQAILNKEPDMARICTQVHFTRSVASNKNKVRDYNQRMKNKQKKDD